MRKQIVWLALMPVMLVFGCGHRAAEEPSNVRPAREAAVPLPEWAPENPSPEFLRAARVLKPIPGEMLTPGGGTHTTMETGLHPTLVARTQGILFPAAYEFFGSFSDQEIERFLQEMHLRIRVQDLTSGQRAALDNLLKASHESVAGFDEDDFEVTLFKMGAKEDLSNVDTGFSVHGAMVHVEFWIRLHGGKETFFNSGFALF